jgi:glycosyltransferase involved in cell wall biosynthesis
MKILHISQTYFPAVGGGEALTRLIAEEMSRSGNESMVFTANANCPDDFHRFNFKYRPFLQEELINGVGIRRFDLNPWLGIFYSGSTNKIRGGWRLQNILAGRSLDYLQNGPILPGFVEAIGKIKPDIMLAINSSPWTTYAAGVAKKRFKIPFILIPSTHTAYSWAYTSSVKEVYKGADCIIVSTEFEFNHLIKQGVAAEKIHIVAHAINQKLLEGPKDISFREKYHIAKDQPVILYLGRKVQGKGVEELLRSMRLIWQDYPGAYLILAGKAFNNFETILNKLFKETDQRYIKQIINVPDFRDSEIKQIYDAADIFAMPSNIDSFGLVYLEAWSRQLPVIACRNTAQESFIEHGKTGYLVDYGNVESLAAGLKYFLDHQETRMTIGKNGHDQLFKEHTVEIYGQRLLNLYQDFLRR